MRITLITTGGTLDGTCHDLGTVAVDSPLQRALEAKNDLQLSIVNLCNKDSRDLTIEDRELLLQAISEAETEHVLVSHGTYTICETGRFLQQHCSVISKCVLLVGAWVPIDQPDSDAPSQVSFALDVIDQCQPGIYVAMDGKLWDPSTTEKTKAPSGTWFFAEREN